MPTVITGAAGFIGRALAARLSAREGSMHGGIRLVDRTQPRALAGCECLQADLTDARGLRDALAGAERVIHLASLPGGAAEADPGASRAVNLDASLNLIDVLAGGGRRARLVYASSIAVFGAPLPDHIDDATPPHPAMTYGTHKLMVEYALADAVRRGAIEGIALRLPGVVARPAASNGLKSAFMSDIFWALRAGDPYDIPVESTASLWLLSLSACVDALIHAAYGGLPGNTPRVVTLPALHVTMAALVAAIGAAAHRSTTQVRYVPDGPLTEQFGRLPPLETPAADSLGFVHDGTLECLVQRALSSAHT